MPASAFNSKFHNYKNNNGESKDPPQYKDVVMSILNGQ